MIILEKIVLVVAIVVITGFIPYIKYTDIR